MHHLSKKKKELIRRIVVYIFMIVSVCVTVTLITLLVLGFRFNIFDGQVEQYAFLQYSSVPSGATVTVDGTKVSAKTPTKSSVKAGLHQIEMKKDGYKTWSKSIDVKAGTLTWLSYALLIPKNLSVETVENIDQVYSSLPTPKSKGLIIQYRPDAPLFELVDVTSNNPKITKISIPTSAYSDSLTADIQHGFLMKKWDESGRYVIVKHTFGDKFEWLVFDTQNPALSKNISLTFDITIESIDFSGTSGNNYYIIQNGDVRKLDMAAGTISKVLASNVSSMFVYEANIVVYAGKPTNGSEGSIIGVYRDGDESTYVIRTLTNVNTSSIKIATTNYFNQDYIAYSDGQTINLIGGKYPNNFGDSTTTLSPVTSFTISGDIISLSFSLTGQYVMAQSSLSFSSYNIEYQILNEVNNNCTDVKSPVEWLDENYVWSTCGNSLIIQEFDGANAHTINPVLFGQSVVLTHNGRYIYSINKNDTGYDLQRAKIILS